MVLCSSCKKTICRKMIINLNLLSQVNRREHRGGKILVKSWSLEGGARWAKFYHRVVTKHTLIKPPSPPKWWEFVTEVWFWHFDSSSTDFVFSIFPFPVSFWFYWCKNFPFFYTFQPDLTSYLILNCGKRVLFLLLLLL